jgi:hypothetical protein
MCTQNGKTKENFESLNIEGVQLFTANNYGGTADTFKPGNYNSSKLQNTGPRKLKSIKIGMGYEAVLYQNDNFTGYARSITADVPDLSTIKDSLNTNFSWNIQMQSLIVRKYIPPPTDVIDAQFTEVNFLSKDSKEGLLATLPAVKIIALDPKSSQNVLLGDPNNINSVYWYRSPDLQFSAPFNPKKISNLQIWLDGTDPLGNGQPPKNNTVINTWVDKSGNGNNFTVAPNFQPPISKNSGINFDNNQVMISTNSVNFTPNKTTIFLVCKIPDLSGMKYFIAFTKQDFSFRMNNNNFGDNNFGDFSNNNNYITNTNGSNGSLLINTTLVNVTLERGGSGRLTLSTDFMSDRFFRGLFNEILIFDRSLSNTERQSIEGYLAWKWGLQSKLPGPQTPFNLSSMGSLFLWLDGKDTLNNGSPPANDSIMTIWNDKSGNGYNANCNGSIKYNSNFGPSFNGTSGQNCKIPTKFPNGDTPYSIFIVAQYIRGGTDGFLFETGGGGANGNLRIRSQNTSALITDWSGTWLNGQIRYSINKSFIFSTHYQNGGDMAQYFNGSMDVNTKPNAFNFLASNEIALGTNSFLGYISEIIVFTLTLL